MKIYLQVGLTIISGTFIGFGLGSLFTSHIKAEQATPAIQERWRIVKQVNEHGLLTVWTLTDTNGQEYLAVSRGRDSLTVIPITKPQNQ